MEKRTIGHSELVLTKDARIYHLNLKPDDVADTIFLVGDPGRVALMSSLFDRVDTKVENREFVTHTGTYNNKRVSVISTGIGTDNIDIVMNELDALLNIDLENRTIRNELKVLNVVRLGTSGALHKDIEPGNVIITEIAGGLDNLMHFYGDASKITDSSLAEAFTLHMNWPADNSRPYFVPASKRLLNKMKSLEFHTGITLSAPGFYAPQGRVLRSPLADSDYVDKVSSFRSGSLRINNFEMEGSALYGLSALLGHHALTVCIALANRVTGRFITDYKPHVIRLLEETLHRITQDD